MGTAIVKKSDKYNALVGMLEGERGFAAIQKALPGHLTPERMIRVALTAIGQIPSPEATQALIDLLARESRAAGPSGARQLHKRLPIPARPEYNTAWMRKAMAPRRHLAEKSIDIQHDHHKKILAPTHIHLSHDLCAEMIMVRGEPDTIRHIADHLRRQRGVLHAALSMSSTGKSLR